MAPRPDDRSGSGQQYFAGRPVSASRPGAVTLSLPDGDLELGTDRGVFSPGRIDLGTRELLLGDTNPPAGTGDLVDLGAGYGPITLTLARRAPAATVWAVEVNQRAVELCWANAVSAGVEDRVRVVTPDEVPTDLIVDGVWSNPPVRIGKPALQALLATWLGHLAPGGSAHLVISRHLGADSLARWLADQGHLVTRVGSRKGYRLLRVTPT